MSVISSLTILHTLLLTSVWAVKSRSCLSRFDHISLSAIVLCLWTLMGNGTPPWESLTAMPLPLQEATPAVPGLSCCCCQA